MSRSSTQLIVFALPEASTPPSRVAATTPSPGTPPAARNITGTVVISSNSMMRGLVRPTYALITSRTDGPGTSSEEGSAGSGAVGYDVVAAGRGSTAVTNTSNELG